MDGFFHELLEGGMKWMLDNLGFLIEASPMYSTSFRLELYEVIRRLLLVMDFKELTKDILVYKYGLLKIINARIDQHHVITSSEFMRLIEILEIVFQKNFDQTDTDAVPLAKVNLNMNLVKQFIELGGFDKIEHCGTSYETQRRRFVDRYSAACFDPDDLSLNTEISSSDHCCNSENEVNVGVPQLAAERRNKGFGKS